MKKLIERLKKEKDAREADAKLSEALKTVKEQADFIEHLRKALAESEETVRYQVRAATVLAYELGEQQDREGMGSWYCADDFYFTDCGPVDDAIREYKTLPEWEETRKSEKKYGGACYKGGYFVFLEEGVPHFNSEHEAEAFDEKVINHVDRFKARAVCVQDCLEYDTVFVKYGYGGRAILKAERIKAEEKEGTSDV